ncbi:MAG: hypothetical protein HC830_02630, partial [Bacteroidetes bacterium]|nr:hypothetical protein [Bacteroidota bacterium]
CLQSCLSGSPTNTGFYLQVELPNWSSKVGKDTAASNFWKREAAAMLKEYGNHPSFCFMSMGNELEGDFAYLKTLLILLKSRILVIYIPQPPLPFSRGMAVRPKKLMTSLSHSTLKKVGYEGREFSIRYHLRSTKITLQQSTIFPNH